MAQITTKEQERQALQKIRKIVNDLGENSYVGTAFEGCFEIAEENIDKDAAFSMKGQKDILAEKCRELRVQLDAARADLDAVRADYEESKAELELERNELRKRYDSLAWQLKDLKARTLSGNDLLYIVDFLSAENSKLDSMIENAANRIVEFAGDPSQDEFVAAVKEHRDALKSKEDIQGIQSRLNLCISRTPF